MKTHYFANNILLQFLIFYSYDDLKIAMFTDKEGNEDFKYLKYLNHSLSDDKSRRFYSSDQYSAKILSDYIIEEIKNRTNPENEEKSLRPYFLIIIDGYDLVKKYKFADFISEVEENIGFSVIIIENHLNKLPSKCSNFISIGDNTSTIVTNSYENQENKTFKDEINYSIKMSEVAKVLSNIPVEIRTASSGMPSSITFLEMEKVGKTEQLNIMERWKNNNSTETLKAEVGVDNNNELIYLDLHEKAHGPHGLIAGTTGSGKSEFIITYILSMAINYSPDDVSFILIDYKGGGLAYAFENKANNLILPHLAGTITNLDKSEMDRTLESINSEVKRRQKLFNTARDLTRESTIDIYKYQKHFHDGELDEPCPHLFIICDEFAELKSQQPEFMDDLISVARIGRSLGVHLILATQKPTGQVNEQIWTNTRFRVCLKVQNPGDSREMLKRPEAAYIREAGRFYLQVGQDELFILGQSGWAGAKYYPSNTIVKEADKSVNVINDTGVIVKSIKAGGGPKLEAQGEQLAAVMKEIIEVAGSLNKKSKRLWLDNIPSIILVDDLIKKYNIKSEKYNVKAVIGEYDAPEIQTQGLLSYSFLENENTLFYGIKEAEREQLTFSMLYSIFQNHTAEEINVYIFDFGSASMEILKNYPQVGEVSLIDEDEKFKNTLKLFKTELANRKKEFINYGGDYKSYIKNSEKKVPVILLVINNLESLQEIYRFFGETLLPIARDCARYGMYIWVNLSNTTSIGRRLNQTFKSSYCLHMKDFDSYRAAVPGKSRKVPRSDFARGLVNNGEVHEFQTAMIVENSSEQMMYIKQNAKMISKQNSTKAKEIAKLPEKVTFDLIKGSLNTIEDIPIGIDKETLEISKFNFSTNILTSITGMKIDSIKKFINSLIDIFKNIKNVSTIFIDPKKLDEEVKNNTNNYFYENMDKVVEAVLNYVKEKNSAGANDTGKTIIIIYGIQNLKNSLSKTDKLGELFKELKKSSNINVIICDGSRNIKSIESEIWFIPLKNNTDGIWIGKGFQEQQAFRLLSGAKTGTTEVTNSFGFNVTEQSARYIKLIDFLPETLEEDQQNEK